MAELLTLAITYPGVMEGALRAQAELDAINNKLYATVEEDIPDEYRDLVQEYYRVLSENQGSENQAQ